MLTSCYICTYLFENYEDIVSIPCGHVFHSMCLIEWLRCSKTCPQCRSSFTLKKVSKLYLNAAVNQELIDMTNQCENANAELTQKAMELEAYKVTNRELQECVSQYEIQVSELRRVQNIQENQVKKLQLLNSIQEENIIELHRIQDSQENQIGELHQLNSNQKIHIIELQKIQIEYLQQMQSGACKPDQSMEQRVESVKHIESKWQELSQKVETMTNNTAHICNVPEMAKRTQEYVDTEQCEQIGGFVGAESCEDSNRLATFCSLMKRALNKISSFMSETEELKKDLDSATRNLMQENENLMRLWERMNDVEKDNSKQIAENENLTPFKKRKLC